MRRVEDLTEARRHECRPSTVSDLNKKIYVTIEVRRNRPIEGEHPCVYLDGLGRTSSRRATSATLASGLKLASSAASQPTSTAIAAPGRTEPQPLLQAVIEGWSPGRFLLCPPNFCASLSVPM